MRSALAGAAFAAGAALHPAALWGSSWAHEGSDLKPDPAVTFGVLENGLRYAILPNPEPPEKVSLRLFVDAGSLNETEEQRGVAHFLEHMAFNGTRGFPGGEMVEYFQRLGMAFGADTNAHTSFDETVYKLELPRGETVLLEDGLKLFRDYADGMLLRAEEIDKERGVILAEKRTRDSVDFRTMEAEFAFLLPGSIIPRRLPIGTEEVIEGAPRQRFVDFYQSWYTSDRLALVAVGAVDPAALVPMVEKHFGALPAPAERRPDPDLGKVTSRGQVAALHTEKEASATRLSIQTVQPYTVVPDSRRRRAADLHREVAIGIVSRRLEILAKQEGAPFSSGSAYAWEAMDFVRLGGVELICTPENWQGALAVAEQELRRALEHGFTGAELAEIVAKVINSYEQRVKAAATRKSRGLADQLVSTISGEQVFTSPADDLALAKEALAGLTPAVAHRAFRSVWATDDIYLFVSGNLELAEGSNEILGVYRKSAAVPVEPPEEAGAVPFAYTYFGEPSAVAETVTHEDLGVTQVRFTNNVRLNLKPTDFEKNTIRVLARFGGGRLTEPQDKPGLALLAGMTFGAGGLAEHSADDLERILAGKTVGVSFAVADDAFVLSGRTTPDDIDRQLQLMCAYLVAPGFREEALRQASKTFEQLYLQLRHTPEGVAQNEVERFLASGDPRFGFPAKEELGRRTLPEVRGWLEAPLKSSYLEISLVGDFDPATVTALVNTTFGALPPRREKKPDYAGERALRFPDGPPGQTFNFETKIPKALTLVYWPTDDFWDIARTRRLNLLSQVFSDRLRVKVREEIGEAYSPYARNNSSETYPGYGYLRALCVVDPGQAAAIGDLVRQIAAQLVADGVGDDEFQRVVAPVLTSLKDTVRDNRYWLSRVLASSQEQPQRLGWARTMEADYTAATAAEIGQLARTYLPPARSIQVNVVPVPAEP